MTLNPAQSRPFALVIRSQVATGTLPFNQRVGLISVGNAAAQSGSIGVATGNDVQLDDVAAENCPSISLEDFPGGIAQPLAAQFPGLTVRRAFRYSDPKATALLKASAVEPDVRVETQDTLSLGEDRTVLATTADVTITRAGIFKLSFVMPPGFDVESISGGALSHWTELKTDAGRVITLNLTGKTDGQQQFIISLSGPGLKTASGWAVPQILLREADKQRGTLLVVPEQGMRLEAAASDGVTQLDPQKSGVRQKGVLAFRILETPWKLALNIEQVDPWVQVTSLQHATVGEALVKVTANLQYQIENAGLKEFRVFIPTNAEGVTFQGDQARRFSRGGRLGDERFAGVGRQTAPARHRPVFVAGQLPDARRRAGGRNDFARRAGGGREFAAGLRDRAIRRTPPGARGRFARVAPADRVAGDSARAAKGFVRRGGEFRVSSRRAGFSIAVEAGAPRRGEAAARAGQRHHVHLGDFRRGRHAHAGAAGHFARATSACCASRCPRARISGSPS